MLERGDICELISRRRRQILAHSVIYYMYNESLISDNQWAEWASELYQLQIDHPYEAEVCPLHEPFKDFDPSTGYNLPLDTPWAVRKAELLIKYHYENISGGK